MPPKTAILKTRVPAEVKNQVLEAAKKNAKTESEFLRSLIFSAIAVDVINENAPPVETIHQYPIRKLSLRLPEMLLNIAKLKAIEQGISVNTWIEDLIQSTITGKPIFHGAELMALKESNRQLSAIGNNLNQITRGINADPSHNVETGLLNLLKTLHMETTENRNAVIALLQVRDNGRKKSKS